MDEKKTEDVEVRDLNKYFGRRKVLDNVSFSVAKGGFLSIFGPNGAGKTTLLKILSTLLPPSSGEVFIASHPVRDESTAVRRKIGLISHNSLLYLDLNAYENLKFYGAMYEVSEVEERINYLLDKVELSARRYDTVRTYSRGMQQRLTIARALLHKPQILFLDEPHSGLDPHAVEILDNLFDEIKKDHTFVMVTHNLEQGLNLATQAMIIDKGKVVLNQPREELDLEAFRKTYLKRVGTGVH